MFAERFFDPRMFGATAVFTILMAAVPAQGQYNCFNSYTGAPEPCGGFSPPPPPPPPPDPGVGAREAAQSALEAGGAAFDKRDWSTAIDRWNRALALCKTYCSEDFTRALNSNIARAAANRSSDAAAAAYDKGNWLVAAQKWGQALKDCNGYCSKSFVDVTQRNIDVAGKRFRDAIPNLTISPPPWVALQQEEARKRAAETARRRTEIGSKITALNSDIAEQERTLDQIRQEMRERTHDIWDNERSINEWLRASETARENTREIARELFMSLSKDAAKDAGPWAVKKIPPETRKRIEKKIDEYTRKGGEVFRKIEPYNPKFLTKAYETIKHLRDAGKYYEAGDYDQAVGSILEAYNTAFPNKHSDLIKISYEDGRLWIADFYSFATYHEAQKAADQMSAVQGQDLQAIKSLSKSYELRTNKKQDLLKQRADLERELHQL